MYQSPTQKQLDNLLEQGNLGSVISSLMHTGDYTVIAELFNAYKYTIHTKAGYGDDREQREIEETRKALDVFQGVLDKLPEDQRTVFLALAFKGMGIDYAVYTYNESDFKNEFVKSAQDWVESAQPGRQKKIALASKKEKDAEYAALSGHPFVAELRDTLRYSSREAALETLSELWQNGDKDGFFYVYDAVLPIHNREQYKRDPDYTEDTFTDQIATHPGLEFVVLHVYRGNMHGNGIDQASLPPLRILISNKPKPLDYQLSDAEPEIEEGWAAGAEEPDFWILTAKGKFTSLKSYMNASLKNRSESIGHGPYSFSSNDDRTYGTAANVMAEIHKFLRVPKNFEASAQDRLQEQVQSIETSAFGEIYMNRFLRAQEWSTWHAAVGLSHSGRRDKETMLGQIGYTTAVKTMVTYGLVDAVNFMDRDAFDNEENAHAIFGGYLAGMQQLHDDMLELSRPEEDISAGDALDRFERTRGFQGDVLHFPVQERKRLAFQDLSDMAVGHLNGHMMMDIYYEDKRAQEREKSDRDIRDDEAIKQEVLSQVPFEDIADVMIKAGDVTNFMRLYEHQQALGTKVNGSVEPTNQGAALEKKIKQAGYFVSQDRLCMTRFNNQRFRAVVSPDVDFMIRTGHMVRFKTPEQIVMDDSLIEAIWAREVISGFKPTSEASKEKYDLQTQTLTDFIEKKVLARDIQKDIKAMPEDERGFYVTFMSELLPHAVDQIEEEEALSTHEKDRVGKIAAGAFDEATGRTPRATFGRVIKALSAVSGLWKDRTPD